jgi:two-component system phosphate regulon sensor histidine kinase PhoR
MTWVLPRIAAGVLAALFGGGLGLLLGWWLGVATMGALVGGSLAVAMVAVLDTLRGNQLIEWLRGSQASTAPRDSGFWGELGYRVERSIRLRERDMAQERVRLEQFLSAIEASPNGVMMLDAADQIEWCNSVSADHFGLDPQRDRRQPVTNLVRTPAFVSYLQSGRFTEPVVFHDPRAGAVRTLSVLVRPYGEAMKLVLSQDITERESAEAMRRDFVANVSHEIRTPLTVLAGFIETMANLSLSEAEMRRVLLLMGQQASRMQALVADLLVLAQLEGSPRPTADRWVGLRGLLAQVEAEARPLSAGRHTLSFAVDGDPQVAGVQSELLSAVTNVVNNAIRYTPEGGRVDVRWRVLGDGTGELAVTDNGPGIGREHLPRITERFYRVDGSRSRETGGTGLGLAIVKHVVQRHGGELQISSELGQGSEFRIVLPSARVRQAAPSGDAAGG